MLGAMILCGAGRRHHRAAGLPPAAQRAAAGAADHGDRDVVHPRERDAVLARPLADPVSARSIPNPVVQLGARDDRHQANPGRRAGRRRMMIALQAFVYRTGWARRCARPRRTATPPQLMGIDINTTIALTFLIGSALAGAAGFVSGIYYGSTWFFNGFGGRAESLHRGGARRDRQPHRRDARRVPDRPDRGAQRRS